MTACHPERLYALVPFCVHVLYIRGITQINALPSFLWRYKCCPWRAPSPSYRPSATLMKASTYRPISLHLLPSSPIAFLPSWPCLWASPLEGQVNRGPGPAQARLVPIRFLIRHFIFSLTACLPAAKALSQNHTTSMCVCMCILVSAVWWPWGAQPHFSNHNIHCRKHTDITHITFTLFV